jgi:cyclophilin family peptidyl-prolyl cis-trans isomerase
MRSVLLALMAVGAACGRPAPAPTPEGGDDASVTRFVAAIARAEDQRRAKSVTDDERTSQDVAVRRRAVQALARIGDAEAEEALLRALSDEDAETTAWAAYGLGWACKGREDAHVRALAARAASLSDAVAPDGGPRPRPDPRTSVARALGRCGGPLAEQVLTAWVRARGVWSEPAAYALGDIAARTKQLGDDTSAALLDAAGSLDFALYPFGRAERVGDGFVARVVDAAHRVLAGDNPMRSFAIRALGRSGRGATAELVRIVESKDFRASERAEAARGLGQLGDAGRAAAAEALAQVTPDKDPLAITALGGDEFGVLSTLLGALRGLAPKTAEPALYALAGLKPPGEVPAALARRIADLRCSASAILARAAYDAELLKQCDKDPSSEPAERARLAALVQRPLTADRRVAWKALAKSKNLSVREAALDAVREHAELAEIGRAALADALESGTAGLATVAAEVLHAQPDRALALAESERRAALDPRAPPPTQIPAREVDPRIATALQAALDHAWSEDLVETRAALVDAAVALRLPHARDAAMRACHDANVTMREHATRALRALGEPTPACAPPDATAAADAGAAAAGADPLAHPTQVTFTTDAGDLRVVFDPVLAPIAAARFVALARAGFYKGIVVHRVVPGFVAQFGDPEGDGYGGSGALLRCETSPVAFERFDVGVALAGRDTGSSQLFVTLDRFPHLDGEYARIGHAEGDWDALAQGDVIHDVKVDE